MGEQLDALAVGNVAQHADHLVDELGQIEAHVLELDAAGLDLGEVEDLVDDRQQAVAGPLHTAGIVALLVVEVGVEEQLGQADHCVHRGSDLVTHRRQELRLHRVRLVGRVASRSQVGGRDIAIGDVVNGHDQPVQRRVLGEVADRALHRAPVTVVRPEREAHGERVARCDRLAIDDRGDLRALIGMHVRHEQRAFDVGRGQTEHVGRRRALIPHPTPRVDHGDEVGEVVDERPEPRRLPSPGATEQQPHGNGRSCTQQAQDDLHLHQTQQCVAGIARDTAGRITGHARQLRCKDAHLADIVDVRRRIRAGLEDAIADGGQLEDQVAGVLQLAADARLADGGDRDRGVRAALWGRHLTTLEQHGRRVDQDVAALVGVGLETSELEEHVFDVALDERSLSRRHIDDQGRIALVRRREPVVADHRGDEHEEHGDRDDDPAVAPQCRASGTQTTGRRLAEPGGIRGRRGRHTSVPGSGLRDCSTRRSDPRGDRAANRRCRPPE